MVKVMLSNTEESLDKKNLWQSFIIACPVWLASQYISVYVVIVLKWIIYQLCSWLKAHNPPPSKSKNKFQTALLPRAVKYVDCMSLEG